MYINGIYMFVFIEVMSVNVSMENTGFSKSTV